MKAIECVKESFEKIKPAMKANFIAEFTKDIEVRCENNNANIGKPYNAWSGKSLSGLYNFTTSTDSTGRDSLRYPNHKAIEKFAEEKVTFSFAKMLVKITSKLETLDTCERPKINGTNFTIKGTFKGHAVKLDQQTVLKVSAKGNWFYQYPARIYFDDKFVSEKELKEIVTTMTNETELMAYEMERAHNIATHGTECARTPKPETSLAEVLHGGARAGAGRKSLGDNKRQSITMRFKPELKEKLQQLADKDGVSISRYIEQIIENS